MTLKTIFKTHKKSILLALTFVFIEKIARIKAVLQGGLTIGLDSFQITPDTYEI